MFSRHLRAGLSALSLIVGCSDDAPSTAGRGSTTCEIVRAVEALVRRHFETEPFHNLPLIFGPRLRGVVPGGTCSDKTLSFIADGVAAGFDVALHSGFIGGQEIHRLARIRIAHRLFFADVGNGWPSLRLYPSDREVTYSCFGMSFRTRIEGDRVSVFHEKQGRESLQLEIDVRGRPEADIRADIRNRFRSGIVYPFSGRLRFSMVVGDKFLFLRGDRLEIYSDEFFECIDGVDRHRVTDVLLQYFGHDIRPALAPALDS